MKRFDKMFILVLLAIILIFAAANGMIIKINKKANDGGRPYQVEIKRVALEIQEKGLPNVDLEKYQYIFHIEKHEGGDFFDCDSDYGIREIDGELYRIEYSYQNQKVEGQIVIGVNALLAVMAFLVVCVFLFVRQKILQPFEQLATVPQELAKGNLTVPLKENSGRFFGKFVWGVNLLRERMEEQKQRELDLQREKKVLLLSLSHDLKTPLSAIKLYAKALSKGLYSEKEKQVEIAESINAKADEIEEYVSKIMEASRDDFMEFEVNMGEFYLSELVKSIQEYYEEKLALIKMDFLIAPYSNCLIKGDIDRSIEVVQNVMENGIKYGDGKEISIGFSEEDGCVMMCVKNSGCTLSYTEVPHIFESFYRGANVENIQGSGLGLYICRQLMNKMNGEIFAEVRDGVMNMTMVFCKA